MFLSLGSEDPGTDAWASSFVLISPQKQMPGSFGSSSIPMCDTTQRWELRGLNKWAKANAKSCRKMKWGLRAYSELKWTLSQMSTSLLMLSSLEEEGVVVAEETAVSGTHCQYLFPAGHCDLCTRSQAPCTSQGMEIISFLDGVCDIWMVPYLTPCGGWCVSVSCQAQRKQ